MNNKNIKYITFLGTSDYHEIVYKYNKKDIIKSKFTQTAILTMHPNISEIIVLTTQAGYDKHNAELGKNLKTIDDTVIIKYTILNDTYGFKELVEKMNDVIHQGDNIIIDITHTYRHISQGAMNVVKYFKKTKEINIINIYYALLDSTKTYDDIISLLKDYEILQIENCLDQFEKNLLIDVTNLRELSILKGYSSIIEHMHQFNRTIRLCETNKSLSIINEILIDIHELKKEGQIYLNIYLEKIEDLFEKLNKESNEIRKTELLIEILIKKGLYQNAIVYTDDLFRKNLSRSRGIQFHENNLYNLSRGELINYRKNNNEYKHDKIDYFYSCIRNNVCHGATIEQKEEEISDIIKEIFDVVEHLGTTNENI